MRSVFNVAKLRDLLKDFYQITHIRITVFDENRTEIVSYPDQIAHFCQIVRSTETGRIACANCDQAACNQAKRQRKTQIYCCHAGLTEAVAPLIVQNVLVGYLLFGHVFSYPDVETGWQNISYRTHKLPVEQQQLYEAILEQPLIDHAFVVSATQIMSAVAYYLVMEHMAVLQTDHLAAQLECYISEHYREDFTSPELCAHFRIGKTRLYQLSQQLYGCGIAEHIRKLRITYAKELLMTERYPLAEIAEQCGYHDYNYFISVFTREVGVSPHRWQVLNGQCMCND